MYGILLGTVLVMSAAGWFVGYRVYDYFRDLKGL